MPYFTGAAVPVHPPTGLAMARKVFSFEKKNQKTFVCLAVRRCLPAAVRQRLNQVGFIAFQKERRKA
jgi:hypothetical protein